MDYYYKGGAIYSGKRGWVRSETLAVPSGGKVGMSNRSFFSLDIPPLLTLLLGCQVYLVTPFVGRRESHAWPEH